MKNTQDIKLADLVITGATLMQGYSAKTRNEYEYVDLHFTGVDNLPFVYRVFLKSEELRVIKKVVVKTEEKK